MMNTQPAEKPDYRDDGKVLVFKIFRTIQGEGPLAGVPALFVRLAGCNLECPLCDTDYTSHRRLMSPSTVWEEAWKALGFSAVSLMVLTGGEPYRQGLGSLISLFLGNGFRVQIETNGTLYQDLPYQDPSLTIVCSPKAPKVHPQLEPHIAAYKYVLDHRHVDQEDGLPTSVLGLKVRPARPWYLGRLGGWPFASGSVRTMEANRTIVPEVFVQPCDEQDEVANCKNIQAAITSCTRYGYRLSIQTHKVLGLE